MIKHKSINKPYSNTDIDKIRDMTITIENLFLN